VVFGQVPLVMGAWALRRRHGPPGGGGGGGRAAAVSLALAALVAGPLAARAPQGADQTVVLFAPGVSPGEAHKALAAAQARIVWVDGSGGVWGVALEGPSARWALYRRGALLVGQGAVAGGCVSWTRRAPAV
jgi:sarcosine oxidase gamma subunit